MKKILLLLLFVPCIVVSQFKSDKDDNLYFEKVYEADYSKNELKEKVHEWIATNFNDANHVIKMNTDDKIIANGLFKIAQTASGQFVELKVNFSLTTDFKEGRYKVLIDNLRIDESYPVKSSEAGGYEMFKQAYKNALEDMDKSTRKYAEKVLNNEKKMKEMYEMGAAAQSQSLENIKSEVKNMAQDIYNDISDTNQNSDW